MNREIDYRVGIELSREALTRLDSGLSQMKGQDPDLSLERFEIARDLLGRAIELQERAVKDGDLSVCDSDPTRNLRARLARSGIGIEKQLEILDLISAAKSEGLLQKDLVKVMGISPSVISRTLSHFSDELLIERWRGIGGNRLRINNTGNDLRGLVRASLLADRDNSAALES